MNIVISTEKEKLDIDFIHQFLTRSYWAKGRTKQEVITTIEHCLNFGVYINDQQIGFARVLTDYTVFAYLMDVFIIEEQSVQVQSNILLEKIRSVCKLVTVEGDFSEIYHYESIK